MCPNISVRFKYRSFPISVCLRLESVSNSRRYQKRQYKSKKKKSDFYAWIGVYDDPDHQNQDQYAVNLSAANMIIIGSAQTGKTTILQNVIRSLSEQYTPDEVAIYIIDFASMVLKNFETLNHVGGVVSSSEDRETEKYCLKCFGKRWKLEKRNYYLSE